MLAANTRNDQSTKAIDKLFEYLLSSLAFSDADNQHNSEEFRLLLEPCFLPFRESPSLLNSLTFWQQSSKPGTVSRSSVASLFIEELIFEIETAGPDAPIYGEVVSLLVLMARHRVWRKKLMAYAGCLLEILSDGITNAESCTQKVVQLLGLITYKFDLSNVKVSPRFVDLLCDKIAGNATPDVQLLELFANLCPQTNFRSSVLSTTKWPKVLRTLVKSLSQENFTQVLYSLQILVQLISFTDTIQSLFNATNIEEAWRLTFTVLGQSDAEPNHVRAAVDLLESMLDQPQLRIGLESYLADIPTIVKTLEVLASNQMAHPQMFHFATVLLGNCKDAHRLLPMLWNANVVTRAIEWIAEDCCDVRSDDDGNDNSPSLDGTVHACRFLCSLLPMLDSEDIDQTQFDKLVDQLIPSISTLLDCLATVLKGILPQDEEETQMEESELAPPSLKLSSDEIRELAKTIHDFLCFAPFELDATDLEMVDLAQLETDVRRSLGDIILEDEVCMVITRVVYDIAAMKGSAVSEELSQALQANNVMAKMGRSLQNSTSTFVLDSTLYLMGKIHRTGRQILATNLVSLNEAHHIPRQTVRTATKDEHDASQEASTEKISPPSSPRLPETHLLQAEKTIMAIEKLEKEVTNAREQMRKEMELKDIMAEHKISMHLAKSNILKSEVNRLKELLEAKSSAIRQTEILLADSKRKALEVQNLATNLGQQNSQLKAQLGEAKAENAKWREKSAEAEHALRSCEETLEQTEEELNSTREELSLTSERVDQLTSDLENAAKSLKVREKDHETQVAEWKDQMKQLRAQKSSLQRTIDTQDAQIKSLQEKVEELQMELGEQEREHEEIMGKLAQSLNSLKPRKRKGIVVVGGKDKSGEVEDVGELEKMMQGASVR